MSILLLLWAERGREEEDKQQIEVKKGVETKNRLREKEKSRLHQTIHQGYKGWETTQPHLGVEAPQSNRKSLEKMVRYFPWKEAKPGGEMATNGTEEDQSILTPASQGLHSKGEKGDPHFPTVLEVDFTFPLLCYREGIAL